MYPVSNAFFTAVKANTRKYYWTSKITTTAGTVYNFDQEDMVKGRISFAKVITTPSANCPLPVAIRTIYDQYVNMEIGPNGISKYLENHGIRKIQRQNGKKVRLILKNPVYCGKIAYGRRITGQADRLGQ